jgi:hypothetical protein
MAEVFFFAVDVEKLSETLKRPSLEAIIATLVKQTDECAQFIREYCDTKFWSKNPPTVS